MACVKVSLIACLLVAAVCTGCASVATRGVGKPHATALQDPRETRLGRQFLTASASHPGMSGYRFIRAGVDGLALRVQIIRSAERTLDLQYFIFRGDATGTLITEELRRAAERGVRIRVIVDDGDTQPGDEHILELDGQPNTQVRIFNPFDTRSHSALVRNLDFLFHKSRLDYRMHNKLLVADNAIALVGGRNIGNQYFQVDPASQFADDEVFAAGPIVQALSAEFDDYWNNDVVIPAQRLGRLPPYQPPASTPLVRGSGTNYLERIDSGEPYGSLISGQQPLVWASARLVFDSPDKRSIEQGAERGRLMSRAVEQEIGAARKESLIVSPYFAPSDAELSLLEQARARNAAVKVLTNSLESAPSLAAQSGYDKVRVRLLRAGVKLYEVRSRLESTRGSGQTGRVSRYGNYALHAKLYVFDRQRCFIGSWNYDQRSLRINTEMGVLIDSAELAGELGQRIDEMMNPGEAYEVLLDPDRAGELVWQTQLDHHSVRLHREPSRGWWRKEREKLLSLLPLQPEL